jgi:hypothetical protein
MALNFLEPVETARTKGWRKDKVKEETLDYMVTLMVLKMDSLMVY